MQRASEEEAYERQHRTTSPRTNTASGCTAGHRSVHGIVAQRSKTKLAVARAQLAQKDR